MPSSRSSTNSRGTGTPDAIDISSTTLTKRRSCGSDVRRVDRHRADRQRDRRSPGAQRDHLRQRAAGDDQQRERRSRRSASRSVEVEPLDRADDEARRGRSRRRSTITAEHEQHDELDRRAAGGVLACEEVHRRLSGHRSELHLRRLAGLGVIGRDLPQRGGVEVEHAGEHAASGTSRAGCCRSSPSRCRPAG